MPFTYEYPRPAVTVDTVLATIGERGELRVLLIEPVNMLGHERSNRTHGSHRGLPDAVETWSRPNKMI